MFSKFVVLFAVLVLLAACAESDGWVTCTCSSWPPGTETDLSVNVGDRVLFDFDKSELNLEARSWLNRQVMWLKKYQSVKVVIEGHCDERGTREYNIALGERRAQAVRNYLIANGVAASRINTLSYGKERPSAMESNEAAWAQNRRAVTVVREQQ